MTRRRRGRGGRRRGRHQRGHPGRRDRSRRGESQGGISGLDEDEAKKEDEEDVEEEELADELEEDVEEELEEDVKPAKEGDETREYASIATTIDKTVEKAPEPLPSSPEEPDIAYVSEAEPPDETATAGEAGLRPATFDSQELEIPVRPST